MREGKLVVVPVKLTKKELIQYEYNGIEFEDVTEEDKRTFNITSGIKIKEVTNEEFQEYAEYLKGSIVRRVDGILATNMETVSAYLAKKEEKQKTQYEIIGKNGRVYRFIL